MQPLDDNSNSKTTSDVPTYFNNKPIAYDGNASSIRAMLKEILASAARRRGKQTRFERLIQTGTILSAGVIYTPDHTTSLIIASQRKAPGDKKEYSMQDRCPPGTPDRLDAENAHLATLGKAPLDFTVNTDLSDADSK